jgi:hypothetical protein
MLTLLRGFVILVAGEIFSALGVFAGRGDYFIFSNYFEGGLLGWIIYVKQ